MLRLRYWILFCTLLITPTLHADQFDANSSYQVCFTPGENCELLIVNEIEKAKESLRIQAYSFTSAPIAKAVLHAQNRGVQHEEPKLFDHELLKWLSKNKIKN